eukprot:CAMPEP_0197627958 /NCGR_PEP_ID=MMETSP1338-20131121/6420_1 /TAXON_ID=43686 ORGANISM="Pelagodinium beii, Strain RCC1491" /NCGR_SAMPLE_ID=MMETSP1338 /ASSEMBLY_ACC=CAM_ASM_000754 /LENGTH=152 /DNA_ID=CAMNT_0043198815 /DNA_START=49 /DNA_END=508 /DNA_ORIENTATION=+
MTTVLTEDSKDEAVTTKITESPDGLSAAPSIISLGLLDRLEEVRELLKSGDDVNAVDGMGMSALHHAAKGGQQQFASLLIEWGADLNLPAVACHGDTPLHFACKYGRAPIASLLLGHGATDNPLNCMGLTPEHVAVVNNHVRVAQCCPDARP